MTTHSAIQIEQLTKRFGEGAGSILAVDRLDLRVEYGEGLGVLGPNGAGKSTTMKMITGFLTPTAGVARVRGFDVAEEPVAVKRSLGYLPEGAPNYPDMSVRAFLGFIADVRGYRGSEKARRIGAAVEQLHLGGVLQQPIETLSKGFKRRVGLAQAILHEPRVLILDEPTDGLDPNQKHEVRQLITRMARRHVEGGNGDGGEAKAIVLSTHILEEVEAVCTRAVIIAKGRVVIDGTPAQLRARSRYHNAVTMCVEPPGGALNAGAVLGELRGLAWVAEVEDRGTALVPAGLAGPGGARLTCTVVPKGGRPILGEVSGLVKARGWMVETMSVEAGRLDDVFRDLTGEGTSREMVKETSGQMVK